jgi:hypothetical protein
MNSVAEQAPIPLPLCTPALWPEPLRVFLAKHHELLVDWATGPVRFSAPMYDRAIYQLMELLQPYSLLAWHCTRLTDQEVAAIVARGMQPPNEGVLHARIDALAWTGTISEEVAGQWKTRNKASESYRRGRIWWCFFPPREAGEGGIGSLLGTWGGEALYNYHDSNAVMGPLLRSIGTPAVVEVDIPIALLGDSTSPAFSIVAHYLASLGHSARDHLEFEDRVTEDLPARQVRRIVRYPEPDFLALTGCETWSRPIGSAPR